MQVISLMRNKQNDSFFKQNPAIMSLFEVNSDSFVTNNKEIIAKVEMVRQILRFQNLDIFESTNLNLDPWLD